MKRYSIGQHGPYADYDGCIVFYDDAIALARRAVEIAINSYAESIFSDEQLKRSADAIIAQALEESLEKN